METMQAKFNRKIAIVARSDSGIGRAIAEEFATKVQTLWLSTCTTAAGLLRDHYRRSPRDSCRHEMRRASVGFSD